MTFWGIEVKPSKPYTHSAKDGTGRLRISQATLAIGKATLKTLVQCNVGEKRPVLLCVLMPNKTESLQLDLEFDEAEDVTFSCIGPRGVYLTGYYVGHNRQSIMQDDSESYGEDIANSETMESNQGSDEDEYEDSFIDDDEPEPLPASPVLSSADDDGDEDFLKKKRNVNGGHRRLKKRYQTIDSDDEMSVQEVDGDEDDIPISTICKNKKSQASGEKPKKETIDVSDDETKSNDVKNKSDGVNSRAVDSKSKVDVDLVDGNTNGEDDQPNVLSESKSKTKKKKRESSKDKKATDLKEDQSEQNGLKTRKKGKDQTKKENVVEADDEKPIDTVAGESLEAQASAEAVPEKKRKRKRKGRSEATDLDAGTKQEGDQQAIDKSSDIDSKQLANGSQSDEKAAKKKKRKTSKTQEADENTNINAEKENKKTSAARPENKEKESELCNKKTLSNGLVIEDLKTGKSKGKVAAVGKKVKVQYVATLKENGQVIDSNGKSPYKFRLGDKEVIEGLNVGLDGMRVGDRRKLTIPPSMSVGFKGTAENVPPNSWLVYDVEMTSIH
ncbi:peptidyl-prolyl cis-trans isomerase FKBP43 [Tanacetum coccineum]